MTAARPILLGELLDLLGHVLDAVMQRRGDGHQELEEHARIAAAVIAALPDDRLSDALSALYALSGQALANRTAQLVIPAQLERLNRSAVDMASGVRASLERLKPDGTAR